MLERRRKEMSHEFEVGFSVRKPAWHGLAVVLDEYPGREEAIKLAGHDWGVVEKPIAIANEGVRGEQVIPASKIFSMRDWKALVRSDNRRILSVVKGSYQVVQNGILWDIVDALMDQENVKYETAGVLKEGRLLWVLARLDEPLQVKGDNSSIYPYVMVSTAHDGSAACKAQAISIRVVCWNTFSAAEDQSNRSGLKYTFKHTKKVMDRIEDAKQVLSLVRRQNEEFIHLSNELAEIEVKDDQVNDFIMRFIPDPIPDVSKEVQVSERVQRNIDVARFTVRNLLDNSVTIPECHRRTAYGLWAAGVEYLDHLRGYRNPETLFKRTMLPTDSTKTKMMELVRSVVDE
jgi:phage/plasmid-like protein (TIGR03299 family)